MKIKLSVKEIVRFLYSSGDLSKDFFNNGDQNEGKKAHLYLQNKYQNGDISEYYVKDESIINNDTVIVTGFIDGVLNDGTILEEIKSTSLMLDDITIDYHFEHMMQLKMYAYLYCKINKKYAIDVRLCYINLTSYETTFFYETYQFNELEKFYYQSINDYLLFYKRIIDVNIETHKSISKISFPFKNYRNGQRELMKYVYETTLDNDILYAIAPTGIGKTMATIFSTLKGLKKSSEKVFYLTAKSLTKTVALDSIRILLKNGLIIKALEISSKENMCNMNYETCDVDNCHYAKNYFAKLKDAINELYIKCDIWDSKVIMEITNKYKICSFEFSLEMSNYASIIICDYNYAFDPRCRLVRYFLEDNYQPRLLIDEAHNMVNRGKEMYSHTLKLSTLELLKKELKKYKPRATIYINKTINIIIDMTNNIDKFSEDSSVPKELIVSLNTLIKKIELIINNKENIFKNKNIILKNYFELLNFIKMNEYFTDDFRFIIEKNDDIELSIKCLNASKYLYDTMKNKALSTVLFSATLIPLEYYKKLITNDMGDSVIIPSPFDINHLDIIVKNDVSTKYEDREKSIDEIISVIDVMTQYKKGNYIVFFPSYVYLKMVVEKISNKEYEIIEQEKDLNNNERIEIINLFKDSSKTKVAFFVMGGIFSEGIDYIGDMLNGVLIVSACIPLYCDFNNMLMKHFDKTFNDGFNYAYTYPGFTKVVQAVGRVIRSEEDRGIVILFDHRFNNALYRKIMPYEWRCRKLINNIKKIEDEIKQFKNKIDL